MVVSLNNKAMKETVTKGRVKTHAGSPVKLDGLVGRSVRASDPVVGHDGPPPFLFFPCHMRVRVGDRTWCGNQYSRLAPF
jgi:hypothetical protein